MDLTPCYVFGYGSLIWKPPPHCVRRIPGYVKGVVRRFWQSSNDHRGAGTSENPGRVVTLISHEYWSTLDDPHPYGGDDVVWGVAYRIDPTKVPEVEAYLDEREKNGYIKIEIPFYPTIARPKPLKCIAYVGTPENDAFQGPQDPQSLALDIARSHGPSGSNIEYLYNLHSAIRELYPRSRDKHIEDLVKRVKAIESKRVSKAEEEGDADDENENAGGAVKDEKPEVPLGSTGNSEESGIDKDADIDTKAKETDVRAAKEIKIDTKETDIDTKETKIDTKETDGDTKATKDTAFTELSLPPKTQV